MLELLKPAIKSVLYPLYERRLFANLDFTQTPHHVGVILDGNRRWSKANPAADGDTSTSRGHKAGAEKIIDLLDWCEESKVEVLTIWLLSNQNLSRPPAELEPLLAIIADTVNDLASRRRWEIRPVGSMELLPKELVDQLNDVASKTKGIKGVLINVAIGYGGRSEIADAVKSIITAPANADKSAVEIASSISVDEIGRNAQSDDAQETQPGEPDLNRPAGGDEPDRPPRNTA
jgi:short-chain Z-isoprenyl diphosphate synthase